MEGPRLANKTTIQWGQKQTEENLLDIYDEITI